MKKVLISRLSSLGDIILTQPILAGIQQAGDQVTLLTNHNYQELGQLLPGVDEVLLPDQKKQDSYDCLIDLHRTGRSRRALKNFKAKEKYHYSKYSLARRMLIKPLGRPMFWNKWSALKTQQSVVAWYSQAAAQAGYKITDIHPRLTFDKIDKHKFIKQLEDNGIDLSKKIAILGPGAKWAAKQWPEKHFIELALHLSGQGYQIILIGSHEEFLIGKRMQQALSKSIISLIGKTSITKLAVLLSLGTILICNDTGPLHLGLAAGIKTVALFGPTVKEFGFMPTSPACSIIRLALPCQPCSLHGSRKCPLGHHDCMKKITVKQVTDAIEQLLEKDK